MPFIDTNEFETSHFNARVPNQSEIRSNACKIIENTTFDGKWSSDDDEYDNESLLEEKSMRTKKKADRHSFWKHKSRSLAGKIACKYCDSYFESREDKSLHSCEYLRCDPKNFICRICNKELSKNTFSNHLHETLDCPYCGKQFVNPRNMKAHIKKQHRSHKFIQPERKPENDQDIQSLPQRSKVRHYKKKERLECGKILFSKTLLILRSSKFSFTFYRYLWKISGLSPINVVSYEPSHWPNELHL